MLNKRAADAAKPTIGPDGKARETVLWDEAVKGFGLRISPAGARSFVVVYRAGRGRGAPLRKLTLGKFGSPHTVETARREARRLLGIVAGGGDPAGAEAEKRRDQRSGKAAKGTVAHACQEWLRRDQAGNRTAAEVTRIMEREVLPYIGERDLGTIRKRDLIEIVDRVADRGATVRANRVLAWVRRFFNWCSARDLIDANPASSILKPSRETRRERVLDDDEIVAIWRGLETMPQPFRDGCRLLVLTAARRAEIFNARWSELDDAGRCLKLPAERAKSGEGRRIPLSPQAMAIIEGLLRFGLDDGWLISTRGAAPFSNFGHQKAELDKALGLPDWRLHDLRRSAATGLQRLGFRLEVIEAALGHVGGSRAGIVGIYQRHAFHDETREALDAWGRHVAAIVEPGAGAKVVPLRRARAQG